MDPRFARLAVVGTSCAGKTTLARRLAAILASPHVELDALHWGPGWTPRPEPEFRERVEREVAAPRWVSDGNYGTIRPLVWRRATAVVWLDYPFPLVLSRALRRTIRRIVTREELYSGNRETFVNSFLQRDSILWWVVSTHRARRRRYVALFRSPETAHLHRVRLASPAEAELLCRSLSAG